MKHWPLSVLLRAMTPVVRPVMLQEFAPNCCIATCRVLRRVFQQFGYTSEALPCNLYVQNAAMVQMRQRLNSGEQLPDDAEERARMLEASGAWELIFKRIEAVRSEPGFEGHVVLRVRDTLVDGSIRQAERPNKALVFPDLLWAKPDADFFRGKGSGQQLVMGSSGGAVIIYERMEDYSFLKSPDWIRSGSPYPQLQREIIRRTHLCLAARLQGDRRNG